MMTAAKLQKQMIAAMTDTAVRPMRLTMCALARSTPGLMEVSEYRDAVKSAEAYADGLLDDRALKEAEMRIRLVKQAFRHALLASPRDVLSSLSLQRPEQWREYSIAMIADACTHPRFNFQSPDGGIFVSHMGLAILEPLLGKFNILLESIECIAGPPDMRRGVCWVHQDVMDVALVCYRERDWPSLGVLADALEDHGCGEPGMVDHLRGCRPHARGCWVIDRILGYRK